MASHIVVDYPWQVLSSYNDLALNIYIYIYIYK